MADKPVTAVEAANIARSVFEAMTKQADIERRAVEVVIEFRFHSPGHLELWINGVNFKTIRDPEQAGDMLLVCAYLAKMLPITIVQNWPDYVPGKAGK